MRRWRCGPTACICWRRTVHARAEGAVELCTWLGSVVEHVVRLGPETTILTRGPALGRDAARRHAARHARGAALGAGRGTPVRRGGDRPRRGGASITSEGDQRCVSHLPPHPVAPRACWRRHALLAAPAIARRAAPQAAEQCVVGTWGGDYARLLRENIDDPILKPEGIDVVQDVGDETPRVAKLYAQTQAAARHDGHRLPRRDERLPRHRRRPGRTARRDEGAEPEACAAGPAHARLRAAHLQRAGAGLQSGRSSRTRRRASAICSMPRWKGKVGVLSHGGDHG